MKKIILGVIFSNFLGAGFGFLLNVFLARTLSLKDYGKINLLFSLILILFTIFEFGISNTLVIFINKFKKKFGVKNIVKNINSLFFIYLLFTFVVAGIILNLIRNFFSLSELESYIVFFSSIVLLIYRYLNSFHQAFGEWRLYNFLNIANNLFKFLCITLSILIFPIFTNINTYNLTLVGLSIAYFLLIILSIILSSKYIKILDFNVLKINNDIIKDFLKILLPIGLSNIFIIITMRLDNLIIEHFLGPKKLGIYSAANTLALVFPLITVSIMNVFLQKTASKKKKFIESILNNQKKYIPYLLIILILFIFLSKELIILLFGEKYIESASIFRILLIAYIGGIFFTPLESYYYTHYPNLILKLRFFQMIIVVIGMLIVINTFALIGVAIVIVMSRILGWGIVLYLSLKERRMLKNV